MSTVEIYIRFAFAVCFIYGLIVTKAYLDQRSHLRYYKRHYDAAPKKYRRVYKPTVCQQVIDYLMTISPIK